MSVKHHPATLSPEQIDLNTEVTPQDGMFIQVGKRRFARLRLK